MTGLAGLGPRDLSFQQPVFLLALKARNRFRA